MAVAERIVGPDEAAQARVLQKITDFGLSENVIELETMGYTTIKGVLSDDTIVRAQEAILRRVEKDTGKRIDLESATADDFAGVKYLHYMLYDDVVFEEILVEEKPLAIITYLLGESCLLSSLGCHFKGPGGAALPLHSDNGNGMPGPFPAFSQVANVNYALTPYSREAGALAMVPRSHHLARQPTVAEMMLEGDHTNPAAVSMDLDPGDVVVWHGNAWHGSFKREIPGVRMNLACYFARQYMQTQEHHKGVVPQEVLDRNSNNDRFAVLLGGKQPYGWEYDGPNYEVMGRSPRGLYD